MGELSPADLSLFSIEELLELKEKVKAAIFQRKTVINLAFSGKNVGYQIEISVKDLAKSLSIELRRRDPTSYGTIDTRTSATFS